MNKKIIFFASTFAAIGLLTCAFWFTDQQLKTKPEELQLQGNVDLREVNLAFLIPERIQTLCAQEGDKVRKGMKLGTLDTVRIENYVKQAQAAVDAQKAYLQMLKNGPRPQEIGQARANLEAEQVICRFAKLRYDRVHKLYEASAHSEQSKENAESAYHVAREKVNVAEKELDLLLAGTRKEEIARAEAVLAAKEADLAILKQKLADTVLYAPSDGIIRNRILEPGDMASPQKPAYLIALTDPKWVRAYLPEPDLVKVRSGMKAKVTTDSLKEPLDGWVGYISSVAEFTPKTVETKELRTALVYEIRIFVKDPHNVLRLGAPATVMIPEQPQE